MATREERQKDANDPNGAAQTMARVHQEARNAEAVREMRAEAAEDGKLLQRWLDGENVPMPEGVRKRTPGAPGGWATTATAFRAFTPTARVCPQCTESYVGSARFCPTCVDVAIRAHDQSEQKRKEVVDGMTVHEARHKWANLPPDSGRTWDMATSLGLVGLAEAIGAARLWESGAGPPWLVLTGGAGVGKSHIAEVSARELAAKGQRVRWQPVGELLDRLRLDFANSGEENAYAHLAQVAATPWLVLDDLGRSKPTGWVLDTLYMLVNSRAIRQARTLITTNDTLPELTAKLGDAIADRVYDSHSGLVAVVTVTGPSYRTGR